MPKRTDIHKILVIGSGPIVIGQAAEFDYAGTQACLALREEGYEVVLTNSNPATIMTDTSIADKVYMEPLTVAYLSRICRLERPDAILPGIGGQTGLNLAMQLWKQGVLEECGIELLGTDARSIECAADRELFKELCERISEPVVPSRITYSVEEALTAAAEIGYPVILRPAFTLGGTGGGFADTPEELAEKMRHCRWWNGFTSSASVLKLRRARLPFCMPTGSPRRCAANSAREARRSWTPSAPAVSAISSTLALFSPASTMKTVSPFAAVPSRTALPSSPRSIRRVLCSMCWRKMYRKYPQSVDKRFGGRSFLAPFFCNMLTNQLCADA